MFGILGRRAFEFVVAIFALLGFVFVPLGSKTGLEHALRVLQSEPLREALSGLLGTLGRVRANLLGTLTEGALTAPGPLHSPGSDPHPVPSVVPVPSPLAVVRPSAGRMCVAEPNVCSLADPQR